VLTYWSPQKELRHGLTPVEKKSFILSSMLALNKISFLLFVLESLFTRNDNNNNNSSSNNNNNKKTFLSWRRGYTVFGIANDLNTLTSQLVVASVRKQT
jgi:hypothetical protein